jgi:hypothetical protein
MLHRLHRNQEISSSIVVSAHVSSDCSAQYKNNSININMLVRFQLNKNKYVNLTEKAPMIEISGK